MTEAIRIICATVIGVVGMAFMLMLFVLGLAVLVAAVIVAVPLFACMSVIDRIAAARRRRAARGRIKHRGV